MDILKRYILAAIVALTLTGCYKEIDIEDATKPVLCMNSLIKTGEPFFVTLSHTWLYSEYVDSNGQAIDVTVKDATISLYVNDEYVENLQFGIKTELDDYDNETEYEGYLSDYTPKAGDKLRLVAESKEYGVAEATVTMPDEVAVDKFEYTLTPINIRYYESTYHNTVSSRFNLDFYATFTDPATTTNYYMADWSHGGRYWHISNDGGNELEMEYDFGWVDSDVEPLFSEHISALESVFGAEVNDSYFFTDMQISGISYPLHMRVNNSMFWTSVLDENAEYNCEVEFVLYNISEDYYKFLVYMWQKDDGMAGLLQGYGFGDSIVGYSNVSTNAGIVAAMTPTVCKANLDGYIREIVKSATATN